MSWLFSSTSDDKGKHGADWTNVLYFTRYNKGKSPTKKEIEHKNLLNADIADIDDKILGVVILKNNLKGVPKFAGAWHEFVRVESDEWYWTFEKQDFGICAQQSKSQDDVELYSRNAKREGSISTENRGSFKPRNKTIRDIFQYVHDERSLYSGYDISDNNCHHFASLLYESLGGRRP